MIEVKIVKIDTQILEALIKDLGTNTDGAIRSIAFDIAAEAKILAPWKTGALSGSINMKKINSGEYWVQDGVDYGLYQEMGTYKMAAHPFLRPAVEKIGRQLEERFKRLF